MTRSFGSFTSCVGGFTMATGGVFTLDAITQTYYKFIQTHQLLGILMKLTVNITIITLLVMANRPNL